MAGLVVDTHAAVWYLHGDARLSHGARKAIRDCIRGGEPVYVPSISLVELIYLVEKGRVPYTALERLEQSLVDSSFGFVLQVLDFSVTGAVARIPRSEVSDLPDRIIAATALALGLPLVSRDRKIRAANITTLW